jgi:antirestriction protein ArdC
MSFDYEQAVTQALNEPGKIHQAYSQFWRYSLGNQIMAMAQLGKPEPINTYPGWQRIGRQVRKDERGIVLLMPVTKTKTDEATGDEKTSKFFIERRNWFGLSQTDGVAYVPEPLPDFDLDRALAKLEITQRPFEMVDGNTQGYAIPPLKIIAISPIAFEPIRTGIHEIAHILLHADQGKLVDTDRPEQAVREVEAELTAYLTKAALGVEKGQEFSRGYLQSWLKDTQAEKVRYSAVFGAVDKILKAGRPEAEPSPTRPAASDQPRTAPKWGTEP